MGLVVTIQLLAFREAKLGAEFALAGEIDSERSFSADGEGGGEFEVLNFSNISSNVLISSRHSRFLHFIFPSFLEKHNFCTEKISIPTSVIWSFANSALLACTVYLFR